MGLGLRYPSATLLALTWLRQELPGVHGSAVSIHAQVPATRPSSLVVIRRSGGLVDSALRDRPRLDAQCWGVDGPSAELLASDTLAVLMSARGEAVDGVTIGATSVFLGPAFVPDPASDAARYLLTVEWQVPGVQL